MLAPSQTYGLQARFPTLPAARGVHVPVAQLPQDPHPVLQQIPATQLPLWHRLPVVQAEPLDSGLPHWSFFVGGMSSHP